MLLLTLGPNSGHNDHEEITKTTKQTPFVRDGSLKHCFCTKVAINEDKNETQHSMRIITTILVLLFFFNNVSGQNGGSNIKITGLTGDFYIFTTYNSYKGDLVPANGMYVVTDNGVVMFDTPWDTTQFQPLLDSIKNRHHKNVVLCIATHFHEDRTGGLQYYSQHGIKTYTTRQTDELSKKRAMKRAEFLMDKDTVFTVGQYSFQTYFPGAGLFD